MFRHFSECLNKIYLIIKKLATLFSVNMNNNKKKKLTGYSIGTLLGVSGWKETIRYS